MAADEQLKQQIKAMIVERLFLKVEPSAIGDDVNLMAEYNIDSVNLLEILVGLEEVFGISVEDADFDVETFSTVSSIAEYVVQKQG